MVFLVSDCGAIKYPGHVQKFDHLDHFFLLSVYGHGRMRSYRRTPCSTTRVAYVPVWLPALALAYPGLDLGSM